MSTTSPARAAAGYVSQPALSAAIRRLEHELDVPIVRRGRRYEGLIPESEVVLAWAHRILAEPDGLRQELSARTVVGRHHPRTDRVRSRRAAMTYLDDDTLRHVRRFPLYEERYMLLTSEDGPLALAPAVRWAGRRATAVSAAADAQPADHR